MVRRNLRGWVCWVGVDEVDCCRESWKALGDMNQDLAKKQYVEWVQDLFEEFDVRGPKRWRSASTSSSSKATSEAVSLDSAMAGPVSMPKVDMCVLLVKLASASCLKVADV
jgi:hypothetical protein